MNLNLSIKFLFSNIFKDICCIIIDINKNAKIAMTFMPTVSVLNF